MANKKKEVTKAPSGLKITRSENKFTASWKIGDKDYGDGQYLQYSINDTGKDSWQPTADNKKKIGVKTTSKAISIDKDNFYPNKDEKGNNKPLLYEIGFRVKGNRKKYTTGSGKKKKTHSPVSSEWTEERFTVNPPKEPTLTVELDEELTNVCKFSWSAPYESDDSYIFTDTQWQTILVKNNSETDGSKLSWKGETFDEGTAGAESSKTITEDTAILYRDGNSYTRWFRVRARGPRGISQDGSYGWVYEKHVYALPNKTNVTGTSAKETDEGGFQCIVDWTVGQSNGQKPIDKVTVQYTIVVPDENLTCPNGASWTDANISRDTADGDAAVFSIDDQLGKDQCLFIRVNTQHDSNTTYGKPKLSSVGFLKDPTGLSVQTDNVTHKATINATNVSDVEDSVLVVRYVPAEGDPIDVGIIPHGSSSVTVQCPNWDEQSAIGFEIYAMVGEAVKQTREDGVDSYAVTPKMRSQNTVSQGGAVPVAPQNVNVSRVEGKPDTVQVTWDWPWSEAGSAEISWSDHDDAWESTDEPESFLISNLHASKWNISGLETGKTWYIRVRLIAGNVSDSETVTYGPWSDIFQGSIDLSSAPNKPVLILSDSIIPEDGSTTASWVYTTTDNTAQAYAEVAVVENGEYIPIAHSLTSQHVTIPASSENYTLTTGNTYNLVCRVQSASGKLSEWSDVVSLSIAEPLECDIPVSSFVFESTETNPREFTGNPIEFDTELNENIRKLEIALEPTQLGEGTPSPSNVRPIYGVKGVTVDVVGKNLFDESVLLQAIGWTENDGVYSGNAGQLYNKFNSNPIPLKCAENTSYTLSVKFRSTNGLTTWVRFDYSDGTRNTVSSNSTTETKLTLTSNSTKTVVGVSFSYSDTDTIYLSEFQVEHGATATDYVPYEPPTEYTQEFNVSLTPTSTDTDPYLFKTVGDIYGDRLEEDIVGATVNWNQLVENTGITTQTINGVTFTVLADGRVKVNGTATADARYNYNRVDFIAGHKYLSYGIPSGASTSTHFAYITGAVTKNTIYMYSQNDYWGVRILVKSGATVDNVIYSPMCTNLTQMFGSTIADYVYSLEQANTGSGIAWLKSYGFFTKPYYEYNTGTIKSIEATAHITRGVNAWDEEWELGTLDNSGNNYASTTRIRAKNYIPVLGSTTYYLKSSLSTQLFFYDADKVFISAVFKSDATFSTPSNACYMRFAFNNSYGTTYKNDICINISDPTINGKYFPYEKHTYDITPTTLRGKFTLNNGELKCEGDTLSYNKHTEAWSEVDLGSYTWSYIQPDSSYPYGYFWTTIVGKANGLTNMVSEHSPVYSNMSGLAKGTSGNANNRRIYIIDSAYSDPTEFKTAMSGVMLAYEKATPTVTTGEYFEQIQEVSKYGTLEYISNSPVPVGHNSTYLTRDVFGATIDLPSGSLTVDRVYRIYDGSDGTWALSASWEKTNTAVFYNSKILSDIKYESMDYNQYLCETLPTASRNGLYENDVQAFGFSGALNQPQATVRINKTIASDVTTFVSWIKANPLHIIVPLATPLTYQLTPHELETLIGKNTVSTENGNMSIRIAESYEEGYFLTKMPLEATVTGIEEGGKISVVVERAEDYKLDRPDEDEFNGYAGETILQKVNSNTVKFETEEMLGSLDDGAKYNLIATIQDGLGQKAEKVLPFTVKWEHQALEPSAEIVIDEEQLIAKIKPIAPQGADPTDVADIYRLSADKPELIYSGATFGEWYVDPYPALGDMGGHRIVLRTKNGDYITADNQIAMVDSPELGVNPIENEEELNIIDFNGRQIQFYYDTDYSNTWAKDFQETQYLGGSIQGDWNPAVSRSGTLSSQAITVLDQEMLKNVRRLAEHSGICHVRTADGSSYAADVQVSEDRVHDDREMLVNYSLSITRVNSQGFDGMTLESWESEYPDEEEEPEEE